MADDDNDEFPDEDEPQAPAPKAQKAPKPVPAGKKPAPAALSLAGPPKTGGKQLKKTDGPRRRQGLGAKDTLSNISQPGIQRLCRRSGIKRISGQLYDALRLHMKRFSGTIVKDAITYTEHARRKTVTVGDIVHALSRNGKTLYGFGL